jgi:hypothetical protein
MARILTTLLYASMLLSCAGCMKEQAQQAKGASTASSPALKPAPATPIEEKKEELGGKTWDPQWDALVEQALPSDLLSTAAAHAVASYCPRFGQESEADKRAFWAYFFQALAGAEAGLDPDIDVHHTQAKLAKLDTVSKRPIRQEGLLQLTYEDAQRYGCDFDWQRDRTLPEKDPARSILQPSKNLSCGVNIIENQIIKQNKPLIVRSSYWSTLQPGTSSYRVFAKQMANVPLACGVGARKSRRPR